MSAAGQLDSAPGGKFQGGGTARCRAADVSVGDRHRNGENGTLEGLMLDSDGAQRGGATHEVRVGVARHRKLDHHAPAVDASARLSAADACGELDEGALGASD